MVIPIRGFASAPTAPCAMRAITKSFYPARPARSLGPMPESPCSPHRTWHHTYLCRSQGLRHTTPQRWCLERRRGGILLFLAVREIARLAGVTCADLRSDTPSPVTQFTDYGPQPTTPVIYSPSQSPSTTASPASAPTATSPTNNDDTSQGSVRHGLSIEAKAGIVLGVAGGLIIAAIFVVPYLLWKRRESNRSKNPSRRTSKVHWLAPAMMLASFIAGSCLAIGHHLFYQSLNGTSVNSDPTQILGTTFSDQELNIGVGTALSFLVKTFLVLAISIAYVQCFWVIARAYQSHKAMSISDLDAAFSVLNDFLAFKRVLLWLRKPLLLLLALAAW